jgi:predicted nucleic-acid-binding protein
MEPEMVEWKKSVTHGERQRRREAILEVLAKAADDRGFLAELADNPREALKGYCTLTAEEMAALASGDIKKIESWVGKLDPHLATWLWCRLSQEKW